MEILAPSSFKFVFEKKESEQLLLRQIRPILWWDPHVVSKVSQVGPVPEATRPRGGGGGGQGLLPGESSPSGPPPRALDLVPVVFSHHPLQVYVSTVFSAFTDTCHNHHGPFESICITPKRNPLFLSCHPFLSRCPLPES